MSVGLGGELRYADGFVRTSLAVGPSVLLFDTLLDRAGRVGLFVDLRPVGLRCKLNDHFTLGFDPFSQMTVHTEVGRPARTVAKH